MKPLIGITASEIKNKEEAWSSVAYGQKHTYTDSIIRAGGIPVIVPLSKDRSAIAALYQRLDGILFAGGDDLDPAHYGEQPTVSNLTITRIRDEVELQLMKLALADQKPLLCICRGMQVLNVACGGSLYQDIATDLPDAQNHDASYEAKSVTHIAHVLRIDHVSKLAEVVGSAGLQTNTYHHQAVKTLGNNLQATAWAEDGIIEAIELPEAAFAIGIQSHPESLAAAVEPRWQRLFEAFVEEAARRTMTTQETYLDLLTIRASL